MWITHKVERTEKLITTQSNPTTQPNQIESHIERISTKPNVSIIWQIIYSNFVSPVETKFIITAMLLLTYILDYTNHRCKQLHSVVQPLSRECNLQLVMSCSRSLFLYLLSLQWCWLLLHPPPNPFTFTHTHTHTARFELCCYANVRKEEVFISSYKRHFYLYLLQLAGLCLVFFFYSAWNVCV